MPQTPMEPAGPNKEPVEPKAELSPLGKKLLESATKEISPDEIDRLLNGPLVCFFGPNAKERYDALEKEQKS